MSRPRIDWSGVMLVPYGKYGKYPLWPLWPALNFLATAPIGVAAGASDLVIGPGFAKFPPYGVV